MPPLPSPYQAVHCFSNCYSLAVDMPVTFGQLQEYAEASSNEQTPCRYCEETPSIAEGAAGPAAALLRITTCQISAIRGWTSQKPWSGEGEPALATGTAGARALEGTAGSAAALLRITAVSHLGELGLDVAETVVRRRRITNSWFLRRPAPFRRDVTIPLSVAGPRRDLPSPPMLGRRRSRSPSIY